MSKKKKTEEVKQTETNQTQTLAYSGSVTISFKRNGKIVKKQLHNRGTVDLFHYLAEVLVGNSISSNTMPEFIMAYNDAGDNMFSTVVPKTTSETKQVLDTNNNLIGYSAVFTFIVPYTVIKKETAKALRLLNNQQQQVLAEVTLDDNNTFTGDGKTNVEIT